MPKDAAKNIDRYKIKGGQLNEFDFQQNQEELVEESKPQATNLIPGTPPEARAATKPSKATKATKTGPNSKSAKAKKATRATKAKAKRVMPRGATAKKLAARKAAKK